MKKCTHCNTTFEAVDWACPACNFAPLNSAEGFPLLAPAMAEGGGGVLARRLCQTGCVGSPKFLVSFA